MKISVLGTGYVGLVAAACFADKGVSVTCIDIDKQKIGMLNSGGIPIFEPGLRDLIERNRERLTFSTDIRTNLEHADAIILAVGTPQREDGRGANLTYLEAAAKELARAATRPLIVAIKSTVPVGTAAHIRHIMQAETPHAVSIVSNPEFLKEGDAIRDFEFPERVIIGTDDPNAESVMRNLYGPFLRKTDRFLVMNNESAELAKYAANTMLAARISLMNEFARIAEATGGDIMAVRNALALDSRIGSAFLFPSPGYGGSCFPKDVRALGELALNHKATTPIVAAIDASNEQQKTTFAAKADRILQQAKAHRVAIWGAAFKARTDDIRESPTIILIQNLLAHKYSVSLYDPEATKNMERIFGNKISYANQYACLKDADAVIIMTDWNEFKNPDYPLMRQTMHTPIIIDGRNLYEPTRMQTEGFIYHSVGRKPTA